ncbi:hypothetical protein ACXPWS_18115 [Mycobacterium sp. BMJ-28]
MVDVQFVATQYNVRVAPERQPTDCPALRPHRDVLLKAWEITYSLLAASAGRLLRWQPVLNIASFSDFRANCCSGRIFDRRQNSLAEDADDDGGQIASRGRRRRSLRLHHRPQWLPVVTRGVPMHGHLSATLLDRQHDS